MPQAIVPPHAWQAAESSGDWTLVGCTVAPGFEFAKFELAPKGWTPVFVGWVERSDTHQLHPCSEMMGIAALYPSYGLFLHTISFAAIKPPPAIRIAAIAIVAVGCA